MSTRRNQPCPCGSGEKYKKCCGNSQIDMQKKRGISIHTDSPESYYIKGTNYLDMGMLDDAVAAYKKALSLHPDYIEANINLGLVLRTQRNLTEAKNCFEKVLSLSPSTRLAAIAQFNLGIVLKEQGILEKAGHFIKKSLTLTTNAHMAYYLLGKIAGEKGLIGEAIACYRKALSITPLFPQAQTGLAIMAWIQGDYETCNSHRFLVTPETMQQVPTDSQKYVLPFSIFLDQLIKDRDQHPDFYRETKNLPVLYALGDSHSLSLSNIKVNYRGRDHRIESKIIEGCKAWHLGNEENNNYKSALKYISESIPPGSSIIIQFGEIDCRLNEGILQNHKKTHSDLNKSIPVLVNNYLNHLLEIIHDNSLTPILCNVPAPLLNDKEGADSDKKILADIVKKFNQALDNYACEKNIPVLDIYSASKNDAGMADGECHIDDFHLKTFVFLPLIEAL